MPQYHVRPAEKRDAADLMRMRIALQELLTVRDPRVYRLSSPALMELDRFYADIIDRKDSRIFVSVDPHDRPVAMLMVRVIDNPRLEPRFYGRIDDAWVDAEWRRQGVMKALARACCRFLAEREIPLVMLDWANNNPPSGDCWQELGFEPLMTMGFNSPATILARTGKE